MNRPDYYKILGVSADAEDIVIAAAYRALMKKYHPDRNQGEQASAEAAARKINEAYEVLRDPAKRAAYDRERDAGTKRNDTPPPPPPPPPPPRSPRSPSPTAGDRPGTKAWSSAMVVIGLFLLVVGVSAWSSWGGNDGAAEAEATEEAIEEAAPMATETAATESSQEMLGWFGSDYGAVWFGPDGGRYRNGEGVLNVTSRSGNVIEGDWSQPIGFFSGECRNEGAYYGRFRFEFSAQGFTGNWSSCGGAMEKSWAGWRPKMFRLKNQCPFAINVWLRWQNQDGTWRANGPWGFGANQSRPIVEGNGANEIALQTVSTTLYVHAVRQDTGATVIEGTNSFQIGGSSYAMDSIFLAASGDQLAGGLYCPSETAAPAAE